MDSPFRSSMAFFVVQAVVLESDFCYNDQKSCLGGEK